MRVTIRNWENNPRTESLQGRSRRRVCIHQHGAIAGPNPFGFLE